MIFAVPLIAVAVSACANVSTAHVVAPDGKPAIEVRCYNDDSPCLRAADDACPKNGYVVLKSENSGWPRGSSAFDATLLIRCNSTTAGTKPAPPAKPSQSRRRTR
jgi:hypothetical protein